MQTRRPENRHHSATAENAERYALVLQSLRQPVDELLQSAFSATQRQQIIERGIFTPAEDEAIGAWFAKALSIRGELWQIIKSANSSAGSSLSEIETLSQWRWLIIGYSAACSLVRIDRFILQDFAQHKLIQRKLNEPFAQYRISAKRFTAIFSHYVDFALALQLNDVMQFIARQKEQVNQLQNDTVVGGFIDTLPECQTWLDPSKRNYLRRSLQYIRHTIRRRGASAKQKSLFTVMEGLGRTASEISLKTNKQVTAADRTRIEKLLKPGDVLITRHLHALTNLFLPGTWPHAALYIGPRSSAEIQALRLSEGIDQRWQKDRCTLEALKDGVRLRALDETLNVDCLVVIRPRLTISGIQTGIERALQHEGKRYNFDFDFFRADRLVCTEVIYRAYDGIEGVKFILAERAGRKTLAAEDLLDMALDSDQFSIEAIFGYPGRDAGLVVGEVATRLVAESYRE